MTLSQLWTRPLIILGGVVLSGCATESHRALAVEQTKAATVATSYQGPRISVVIGKFANR